MIFYVTIGVKYLKFQTSAIGESSNCSKSRTTKAICRKIITVIDGMLHDYFSSLDRNMHDMFFLFVLKSTQTILLNWCQIDLSISFNFLSHMISCRTLPTDFVRLDQDILSPLAGKKQLYTYDTLDFWEQIKTPG